MRTHLATLCVAASMLLAGPSVSFAQQKKPAASPAATPAAARPPSPEAARARRLFDEERWSEAALVLKRVVDGDTGDSDDTRQIAQYHLAISLYRLQFYQASFGLFSMIADQPNHLRHAETLPWLARLATQLPEPADVIERVGKYGNDAIARFDNPQQRALHRQLLYMLGRYAYRNRAFEQAVQLFDKIDAKSKWYVEAQFFSGISHVQLRRSVPAVKAFQHVIQAIDDGAEGVADEARMRDLANLSMARTFYSASVRLDDDNAPSIDGTKLSAAIKYWNRVDVKSEYWLDALFEESWAYFMAGDFPHALGNIHTIKSPYFPDAFYPEADILKAVIAFTTCQYEDATTVIARMRKKYEPIRKELAAVLERFKGDGGEQKFFELLRDVRAGKASLSPAIRPVVENALSDRQLLRHLEYVRVLDAEQARFDKAPASFRASPLGDDVLDALTLARDLAIRNTGQLARARYQRNLDELNEHLRDASKILVDITAAERENLERGIVTGKGSRGEPFTFVVAADDEHEIWPFDGEYWRDELGYYRQVVVDKCHKR